MSRGAVAQLVHLGDVRLARRVAAEVLQQHDAVARGLVDLGTRRVGLPLVVAVEQLRDAVLRELGLELPLVARHVVADGHEVLVLTERTLDLRTGRDDEVRDLPLERRLLHDPAEVLHVAALRHDRVRDHLEHLERKSETAHHVADALILLALSHGRLRFSGSPLNPAPCRTTRLAYP